MKKIVLVGRDAAPSRAFMKLEPVLKARDWGVQLFVGDGKPLKTPIPEISEAAGQANIVLIGMSSSQELAEPEIAAATAAGINKIPYGFYGDIPRCANRRWFGELLKNASFFFAPNQNDADEVQENYPNATVVATGNPLREDDFFLSFSREQVRERLGAGAEDKLVLVAWSKSAMANAGIHDRLLAGLEDVDDDLKKRLRVFIAYHPGDRTPLAVDPAEADKILVASLVKLGEDGISPNRALDLFRAALAEKTAQLNVYGDGFKFVPVGIRVEQLKTDKSFGTTQAVLGMDLVVGFGSSAEMTAGAQRVPGLTLPGMVASVRNASVTGSETTEALESGASEKADADASDLCFQIEELLTNERTILAHQKRQEKALPKPTERGEAIHKMAKALFQIVGC